MSSGYGVPVRKRRTKEKEGCIATTTMEQNGRFPCIGFIAHDSTRQELVHLLKDYLPLLRQCSLVATGITGMEIRRQLDLSVRILESSVKGGDLQLGALVVTGEVDALLVLRDPLTYAPYETDFTRLAQVCEIRGVPYAMNSATARAILAYLHATSGTTDFNNSGRQVAHYAPQGACHANPHPRASIRPETNSPAAAPLTTQAYMSSRSPKAVPPHPHATGLRLLLGETGAD
jgi:methylglyoxal synthase